MVRSTNMFSNSPASPTFIFVLLVLIPYGINGWNKDVALQITSSVIQFVSRAETRVHFLYCIQETLVCIFGPFVYDFAQILMNVWETCLGWASLNGLPHKNGTT